MTKYKVGTPHRRKSKKVKTNCIFCGATFNVPVNIGKDFLCSSCKEHFREEMKEPRFCAYGEMKDGNK